MGEHALVRERAAESALLDVRRREELDQRDAVRRALLRRVLRRGRVLLDLALDQPTATSSPSRADVAKGRVPYGTRSRR